MRPQFGSHSLPIFLQSFSALPTHFSISVIPHLFCCRPASPLLPYLSLLSIISSTVIVRHCLHRWPCLPSPLSRISTLPPLSSYRVSVAVLIVLSSIVTCTSPPLFVYLLRSDILLALRRSVLHYLLLSAPPHVSHYMLWSSHYPLLFYFGTDILSLSDVLAPLRSDACLSTCIHFALL